LRGCLLILLGGSKKRISALAPLRHPGRTVDARSIAMGFRISGLPAAEFAGWFALSDAELAQRHALRRIVDQAHAFPCRVSLTDAQPGEEVLLINNEHLPVDSPYRSRHAIYIRAGEQTFAAANVVPDMLRRRLLSVRAFDAAGMMTGCDVVEGCELE